MILPIYIYGSPVLREMSKDIDVANYPNLKQLIANMFETMEQADGVGLAAPQVGLTKRLFCVNLASVKENVPDGFPLQHVFINAQIYQRGGEDVKMTEGCLSLPGLNEDVVRPSKIKMRYLDQNLEPKDEEFEGYVARVIQHEYDHIEGVVFADRVAPIRKNLIKSKLAAFVKGRYSASYRCKQTK